MTRDPNYTTPRAFLDLYHAFTGSSDPDYAATETIGSLLSEAIDLGRDGALVIATSTGVYAYDAGGRRMAGALYRASRSSGFFEATAVSHLGPALAYLAHLGERGDDRWRPPLERLLETVRTVRSLNGSQDDHWLDRMNLASWNPHRDAIRNLFDYACSHAGNYIRHVLTSGSISAQSVDADFLSGTREDFPIPFNAVMVGTFALVGVEGVCAVHEAFARAGFDWSTARVILQNCPGRNFSASLSKETNSIYDLLRLLSDESLPEERILITPYAEKRPSVGEAQLSPRDFHYYAEEVWGSLYGQARIAREVFTRIPTLERPERPPLPGDYEVSRAEDIDDFMARLKHSLADSREAQSNTVMFWIGRELHAHGWDPAAIAIPGVTTGFPDSVKGYPAINPEIP